MSRDEIVFETPRLVGRVFRESDLDALAAILCDRETMRYYPDPFTRADAAAWIARNRERHARDGHALWALDLKEDGTLAGDCGLVVQDVDGRREVELGYLLRKDLWGRGLATEAARACLDLAFDRFGFTRVISLVRPENGPSCRVAERIGHRVERVTTWAGLPHRVYVTERG